MKVVVVGGSGRAGRHAARTVASTTAVDRLIVAGRDAAHIDRVVGQCGETATGAQVDITDHDGLRRLLEPADVVLNAVAPYFRHGAQVLDAALATGTHYFDLCDDWEPTLEMLERDEDAAAAGLVAVVGLGLAPGLDSMLAVAAAAHLDEPHQLVTGWTLDGGGDAPPGPPPVATGDVDDTVVHLLHCLSGTIAVWRDGQLVEEPPMQPVELALPDGRRATGITVGSPESVTLHRRRPTVRTNLNVMITDERTASGLEALRDEIDAGRVSLADAARAFSDGGADDAAPPAPSSPSTLPATFGWARGVLHGREHVALARATVRPRGMFAGAGRALGLAPAMYLSDERPTLPGVHPIEDVTDPEAYVRHLAGDTDSSTPVIVVDVGEC